MQSAGKGDVEKVKLRFGAGNGLRRVEQPLHPWVDLLLL